MFSDKSNFLRYMNQFFVSYSAFLIFKIFEEILKKKINLKSYIMIVMLCLITIRVNQNITVFIGNSLNNVQYLFTRNYERYYKKINIISERFLGKEIVIDKIYPENYKQNIEKIFKFTDDKFGKTLMVVSKPYLFNFKKNGNNVEYVEYQFGYSLTKTPYPIFENKDKRIEYLKNRKIKYFLIEKKYINHKNGLVKKFIDKKQNVIIDNQGREKGSHELTAFYDDLMDLLLNNIPKKVINQNETFIVYELKL